MVLPGGGELHLPRRLGGVPRAHPARGAGRPRPGVLPAADERGRVGARPRGARLERVGGLDEQARPRPEADRPIRGRHVRGSLRADRVSLLRPRLVPAPPRPAAGRRRAQSGTSRASSSRAATTWCAPSSRRGSSTAAGRRRSSTSSPTRGTRPLEPGIVDRLVRGDRPLPYAALASGPSHPELDPDGAVVASLTPLRTPLYTRATRATRRRQCLIAADRTSRREAAGGPTRLRGRHREGGRNDQVATARQPLGPRARPAPQHRRAHRRRRPPLHGPAARPGPGGVGRAQSPLPAARLAPATPRGPHRRDRPAGGRGARPAGQSEPMAAHPARRPRRRPPSRRRRGHRLRRGVRRARGAERRSDAAPKPSGGPAPWFSPSSSCGKACRRRATTPGPRSTPSMSSVSRPRCLRSPRPRPASRRSRFPRCRCGSAATGPSRQAPATRRACPSWR